MNDVNDAAWPVPVAYVQVEMLAFFEGRIRTVEIPAAERFAEKVPMAQLDLVYRYGQNDFQPQRMPSVSMGDVIRLHGKRYRVASMGFEDVTNLA